MKTTVDIPDTLLEAAKKVAAQHHTTVRSLIERGLRHTLAEYENACPFRLRKATFGGEGLQSQVADASWERIRDLAYEDHGA
jgi:hypothetical protein